MNRLSSQGWGEEEVGRKKREREEQLLPRPCSKPMSFLKPLSCFRTNFAIFPILYFPGGGEGGVNL